MRPWRASSPHSRRSTSTRSASTPARRPRRQCSTTSKSSTIANACTRASATAPRLRRAPAWRRSPCVQPHDALISFLHSQGGSPPRVLPLRLLQPLHLIHLQAAVLRPPAVVARLRHPDRSDRLGHRPLPPLHPPAPRPPAVVARLRPPDRSARLGHRPALAHENLNLPQLGDNLLRRVRLPPRHPSLLRSRRTTLPAGYFYGRR